MNKFDAEKSILITLQLCELKTHFYGLCILTPFSVLTITVRGYQISIAYCLFFIFISKNVIGECATKNACFPLINVQNWTFLTKGYRVLH